MTIAIIILFLVLLLLTCFKLAVTDINAAVFTSSPSEDLPLDVLPNIILENSCTITEEQLNSYAAFVLGSTNEANTEDDRFRLTDVYLDLKEDSPDRFYMRAKKGDTVLSFASDCYLSLGDGEITLSVENASVGRLPIPKSILTFLLKRIDLDAMSEYIDPENAEAHIPTHYSAEYGEWGELASIDITSVTESDSSVTIETNPVISDSLAGAAEYFKDNLYSLAEDFLSRYS